MNKKILSRNELIGLKVKIIKSTDPELIDKKGIIVDETKNTFKIKINNIKKIIAKKTAIFEFEIKEQKIKIEGSKIIFRPEDRIKRIR
jgi:ribonuclease P protein subunit POP4